MNAYIYQASLYCDSCAESIIAELRKKNIEDTGDSNDWPQGPYQDGGGEADSPKHCGMGDMCANALDIGNVIGIKVGCFLENPLTADGTSYVYNAVREHYMTGKGNAAVISEWKHYYDIDTNFGEE